MALTADHVQGVFGEFKPAIDIAGGDLTANQIQGIFGEFKPVLDNAQISALVKDLLGTGVIPFPR